ncbi:hypothetical protein C1645_765080 [Glomus cerebriforme]|uniref:SWIRM domain-containing protein n=1 Tax=Glomus cerebriforme TaxID=658196 RepID=A0A397T2P8_9GLOM|nr:hypothetical protein C1645_765080 [Glomus cerebriforme]
MYPQMRHYTIYTGEQRYSPAPFSPPPSPPKSEIRSMMKENKSHSMDASHETRLHQPSTSNLNYGAFSYNSSGAVTSRSNSNNFSHVMQHYYDGHLYNKVNANSTTWEQKSMTNDIKEERTTENRMSIDFMLDHSQDEEYSNTPSLLSLTTERGEEIDCKVYAGRKRNCRKNPFPMRAPSKDAPGINLKVDVYTPVMRDPAAILRSNDSSAVTTPTDSVCSQSFSKSSSSSPSSQFSTISLIESESTSDVKQSYNSKNKEKPLTKRQRHKEARAKRSGVIKPERKRKGNSLARVMTDRGLLESIFNSDITSTDIKSVRIPPPPPMQHHELITVIKELNIDHSVLVDYSPDITWKGQPLNIAHLPHYKELHETEAKVVSILRLTPIQYLTGKHTLVSAARRYVQRSLPFKKSDAQKLLRIDVNKASKLWEFFRQVKWI